MVALIAAVLVACSGGAHHRRAARPPTTAAAPPTTAAPPAARTAAAIPPTSVPEAILAAHTDSDGRLDLEGVLELFSYAVRPLPDVTVPSGAPDRTNDWADVALSEIPPHFAELSTSQLRVVVPYYRPAAVPTSATRAASAALPDARLLGTVTPAPGDTPSAGAIIGIGNLIKQAVIDEAAKLGHTLADFGFSPGAVHLVFAAVVPPESANPSTTSPGEAWTSGSHGPLTVNSVNNTSLGDFAGSTTDCTIFISPDLWANWAPTARQTAIVYHEVFHCYQFFVLGHVTASAAYAAPHWVVEGGADWAAASITHFDEPAYGDYLLSPQRPLALRSYDAVGLYFELEYLGRALWPNWWGIWTSAALGGWTTNDWFTAITGPSNDSLRKAWASSYYTQAALGHDWTIVAPDQTSTATPPPVGFHGTLTVTAPPYSTSQVVLFPEPPQTVDVIAVHVGTPRLIDNNHKEVIGGGDVALCWDACSCPSGSATPAGTDAFTMVTGQVQWALTSFGLGGAAQLTSVKLSDFCAKPPSAFQPANPPPCEGICPGTNGDPHMTSVNLRRFDFQAAGEFVLLRSPDAVVEVQARQEPLDPRGGATINTAVAARVGGGHRVGIYATANGLQARIDGTSVSATTDVGGGRLVVHTGGFEVDIPDGTTLWALPVARYGINLQLIPSTGLRDHGVGALARVPTGAALPPLPDGTVASADDTPAQFYAFTYLRFAPAWRVTDSTSLFDYPPGRSTAAYTVAGFVPGGSATLDAVKRQQSESTCQPVVDVELHEDCVYDVAVSGRTDFVAGDVVAETFQAQGMAALDPTAKAPTVVPGTMSAGATVLIDDIQVVDGSVLSPDGTIYTAVNEGSPSSPLYELLAIDPAAKKIRNRITLTATAGLAAGVAWANGSVWLVTRSITSQGMDCQILRVDATTLATQVTIPLAACPSAGPAITAAGGAIWTNDPTSGPNGQGQVIRFDPTTNQPIGRVAVPNGQLVHEGSLIVGGILQGTPTALFWSTTSDTYRTQAPWTTVVGLQAGRGRPIVAGDVALVQDAAINVFGGQPGQPAQLNTTGTAVASDASDAYVDQRAQDGGDDLVRLPLDGSTGTVVAHIADGASNWWTTASSDPRTPLLIAPNAVLAVLAGSGPQGHTTLELDVSPRQ